MQQSFQHIFASCRGLGGVPKTWRCKIVALYTCKNRAKIYKMKN
jgi:hypothetical protein